tara:strand:- start:152 stop:481 length:330 start_codon:yes stop_codon:yes gene_type:complete
MRDSIKNAFDLGNDKSFCPNDREGKLIDKISTIIVNKNLSIPAIVVLETLTPLNYVGSQAMRFFEPIVSTFISKSSYIDFVGIIEKRGGISFIIKKIEEIDTKSIKRNK